MPPHNNTNSVLSSSSSYIQSEPVLVLTTKNDSNNDSNNASNNDSNNDLNHNSNNDASMPYINNEGLYLLGGQ